MNDNELLSAINQIQDIMRSVSTGGARIEAVNDKYRSLSSKVGTELSRRGISNPNEFTDLWQWYGRWSSGDLPSYASRRTYVAELYGPCTKSIKDISRGVRAVPDEPTGWARVDRTVDSMRRQLAQASTEEDYQQVGLLGREALISLAQEVYDPDLHTSPDGVEPSDTDAKRMLDAFVMCEMRGKSYEVRRRHVRASIDLAVELQHQRTASFRDAALCAEATTSVVNSIAIVSGRRDPSPERSAGVTGNQGERQAILSLIQALNTLVQKEKLLREHRGAGPGIFVIGGPETEEDRKRSKQRTEYASLLKAWSDEVRGLLQADAMEFIADWDEAQLEERGDLLRSIIQELRKRL